MELTPENRAFLEAIVILFLNLAKVPDSKKMLEMFNEDLPRMDSKLSCQIISAVFDLFGDGNNLRLILKRYRQLYPQLEKAIDEMLDLEKSEEIEMFFSRKTTELVGFRRDLAYLKTVYSDTSKNKVEELATLNRRTASIVPISYKPTRPLQYFLEPSKMKDDEKK